MSVALVIQHVISMRPVILSSVAYLTLPYVSTYLINGTIWGGGIVENKMCFDFLYNFLAEAFLILRII
jgi:hypothetical protein